MQITRIAAVCLLFAATLQSGALAGYGRRAIAAKKNKCLNPPRTARRVENHIQECQEEVKTKLVNEAYQLLREEGVGVQPPPLDDAVDLIEYEANRPPWHSDDSDGGAQAALVALQQHYSYWPTAYEQQHEDQDLEDDYPDGLDEVAQAEEEEEQDDDERAASPPRRRKSRVRRLLRRIHRQRRVGAEMSNGIYHPTLVPFEDKRIAGCLLHCVYARNNAIDRNGWPTLDGLVNFYSEGVNEHGFFMATLRSVNLCLRAATAKYRVDRRKLPEKGESCDLAFDVFDCISDQLTGYCLDHYKH